MILKLKPKAPRAKQKTAVSPRERNLFAISAWVLALIAALFIFKKYSAAKVELATARLNIEKHQIFLDQKEDITSRLNAHIQRMESGKTLERTELQSLIEGIARNTRLIPDSVGTKTKNTNGIQLLTVTIVFREATMDRLLQFEDNLRDAKIPLTVTSTSITANARDTSLNTSYDIASYRIAPKETKPAHTRRTRVAAR